MRVSWYADTGVAVFSIWQGDTCTGTFRLPIPELPRMVEALTEGPPGAAGPGPRAAAGEPLMADPGPPTAAIGPPGSPAFAAGMTRAAGVTREEPGGYPDPGPGWSYGEPRDRYEAARRGSHDDPGDDYGSYTSEAPGGFGESEPGGYQDLPPGGGWEPAHGGDWARPAGGYEASGPDPGYRDMPSAGYRDVPPAAGYSAPAPSSGRREAPFPPTGPLPVGRWHADEPGGEYPAPDPAGDYRGPRPVITAARRPVSTPGRPVSTRAAGEYPGGRYPGPDPYEEYPEPESYDAYDGYAEPGQAYRPDPLGGDYHGEAEQGYLPGPPTDTFPAAQPPGGYGDDDRDGPPPETVAYRPDPGERRSREYGHSRGRS